MGKGADTRERILEIAETSVLAKGFAATSIEEIIAEAGLTKSGFFYHFRDKNELARAMLRRYVETNDREFDEMFGRARELSDDPLQSMLIGLKFMAESLGAGHPGCLISSICYQERLFDREIVELTGEVVRRWNARFRAYLAEIEAVHRLAAPVDLDDIADMLACVVDGAIIMAKTLNEPAKLERQILAYRAYVRLLFAAGSAARPRPAAIAAE
jgi:TetR/AcrR family transcriptional repressor of nem operon